MSRREGLFEREREVDPDVRLRDARVLKARILPVRGGGEWFNTGLTACRGAQAAFSVSVLVVQTIQPPTTSLA